ncbi:MAG: YibE/F family protein [Anaerolineae bacterium]
MKQYRRIILLVVLAFVLGLWLVTPTHANSSTDTAPVDTRRSPQQVHSEYTLEGTVSEILEEKMITPTGSQEQQLYQKLAIYVTQGVLKHETINVENGLYPTSSLQRYKVGDRLVIRYTRNVEGEASFRITDFIRRTALLGLFIIFIILAVAVGRWQGANSLLGMGITFVVILFYILPRISAGDDPTKVVVLGSLVIIPATFLLSHGVNIKTGIAILGTLIALAITGLLANFYISAAKLTGFATEEAGFLQAYHPGVINIQGLILAGIIIGVLGILDDITVSQSAIVQQLKLANPSLGVWKVFTHAMTVGKDHIASMVNTLILVYAGAALPLLLLFVDSSHPILEVINYEVVAEEIVRTLVASIGLIIAVPITTLLAAAATRLYKR